MKMKLILAGLLVLLMSACGYQTGQIQRQEEGFVKFTGNWENAEVQFDNRPVIHLVYKDEATGNDGVYQGNETEASTRSKPALTYSISPGKHRLKIVRDGQMVVNRVLYIGDQTTMEVAIP